MDKFVPVGKSFVTYFRSENRVLFQSVCPCNEFERFNIVLVIILISEVKFPRWKVSGGF